MIQLRHEYIVRTAESLDLVTEDEVVAQQAWNQDETALIWFLDTSHAESK